MTDDAATSREARLAHIKAEIAAGTYETPERTEAAVDAFLARHFSAERGDEGG